MTRKDYVAIAEAFSLVAPYAGISWNATLPPILNSQETWLRCMRNVANVLAADNPRFDRARFERACKGGQ